MSILELQGAAVGEPVSGGGTKFVGSAAQSAADQVAVIGVAVAVAAVVVKAAIAGRPVERNAGTTFKTKIEIMELGKAREVKAALISGFGGIVEWRRFVFGERFAVKGDPIAQPRKPPSEINAGAAICRIR